MQSLVDRIIDYEAGLMEEGDILALFQDLKDTGLVYQFQGHYQRVLSALIEEGLVK